MLIRRKKLLAILLTAALVFGFRGTSAVTVFAEEEDIESGAPYIEDRRYVTTEVNAGWSAVINDRELAIAEFKDSDVNGFCSASINVLKPKLYKSDYIKKWLYYYAEDVQCSFTGTTDSRDLILDASCYIGEHNNAVSFNIRPGTSGKCLKIYIKDSEEKKVVSGNEKYYERGPGYSKSGGSFKVTFNTDGVKWIGLVSDRAGYSLIYLAPEMEFNQPSVSASKMVGNHEVTYYEYIPYFGKKPKLKYNVEGIIGEIIVRGSDGNEYRVEKCKVERLKNAPKAQGPYPKIPNAGIQITKLKNADTPEARRIEKEIKKLTKVKPKDSYDKQALPVTIYPFRITNEVRELRGLDGLVSFTVKRGKCSFKFRALDGKYITVKDKGKDSFKGKADVSYDSGKNVLSANSADVWTGPEGFSFK